MKNFQAKIAEQTLKSLFITEWNSISLDNICKKLKLDKKKVSKHIKSKHDLLKNINQYFDDCVLVKIKTLEKSSSRDMIFEIFMLRFDLLTNYRISVLNIFAIFKKNPKKFIILLPSFITSIEKIAKASNIKTANIIGRMKIKILLIIYFVTFLTWAKDENPSLEKTMTALDNYLQRAENIIKFFK